MKKIDLVLSIFLFSGVLTPCLSGIGEPKGQLVQISRQCIKIWCLMSHLVENKENVQSEGETIDHLDGLLCRIMRVRDTISRMNAQESCDMQTAEYIDSSLDCIHSYSYDLIKRYPGNWSTIIQEQLVRTQDAYARSILPRVTN